MGTINLVIIEGPEFRELISAFENPYSKDDSALVAFKTLCSRANEADISKYQIISLTHEDGSGFGFKFVGFHALTNVKVTGYYNTRNKHGYMHVLDITKG